MNLSLANRSLIAGASRLLLSVSCLAACAVDTTDDPSGVGPGGKADQSNTAFVIVANQDGSVTGPSEPLRQGRPVHIVYDPNRSVCAEHADDRLEGMIRSDLGHAIPLDFLTGGGTIDTWAPVPRGTVASLWFFRVNAEGAVTCWDSANGQNFSFPIAPQPGVVFEKDGSVQAPTEPLHAGDELVIWYDDTDRPICDRSGEEFFRGHYRFDHGHAKDLVREPALASGNYEIFMLPLQDASHVSLWFSLRSILNEPVCWDSNHGRDFSFAITH